MTDHIQDDISQPDGATSPDIGTIIRDVAEIERALQQARAAVVRRHRLLGVPLVIWRDGRVAIVPADQIRLPGEDPGPDAP